MTGEPTVLKAEGVQLEYVDPASKERLLAIQQLDLSVARGEFVTIVGPSGCGKSSFLKIVSGLIPASAGSCVVQTGAPGRQVALVFQDAALFPWYRIVDNVAFGLVCEGVPRTEARERARRVIELVGLGGFDNRFPYQLSGGMQQRANLARALLVDPALLLMDEPFAAIDAMTREIMQSELLRIWSESRKTVLFVTHQIEEAVYLSDRVIVMGRRPGRVLDDIAIDLPRPRALEVKRTSWFAEYEQRVWELLAAELRPQVAPGSTATST